MAWRGDIIITRFGGKGKLPAHDVAPYDPAGGISTSLASSFSSYNLTFTNTGFSWKKRALSRETSVQLPFLTSQLLPFVAVRYLIPFQPCSGQGCLLALRVRHEQRGQFDLQLSRAVSVIRHGPSLASLQMHQLLKLVGYRMVSLGVSLEAQLFFSYVLLAIRKESS